MTKVLIAAGGSGGHIFPAIAIARALQKSGEEVDVRFVGSDKALDRRIFEKEGFKFSLLSANKFPYKKSLKLIPFFVKLKIDMIRMLFEISSYRPDVVVGFGGYVSYPVVMIASLLRIPVIIHEQNVYPGRANRFLFRFAKKIAITFEETRSLKIFKPYAAKCVFTGNPLRAEVLKEDRPGGIKRFGLDGSRFTILVIGGSQGAHHINETFLAAMAGLDKALRQSLQVVHLTGIKDYEWAVKEYSGLDGLESRVYSFIDRIEEAYSAADLVITRAGSSAIFEVAHFARAMVLVPYPFANAHQAENAKVFGNAGAAVVVDEKTLSAGIFMDNIIRLLNDKGSLKNLGEAARRLSSPDASMKLASEIIHIVGEV